MKELQRSRQALLSWCLFTRLPLCYSPLTWVTQKVSLLAADGFEICPTAPCVTFRLFFGRLESVLHHPAQQFVLSNIIEAHDQEPRSSIIRFLPDFLVGKIKRLCKTL